MTNIIEFPNKHPEDRVLNWGQGHNLIQRGLPLFNAVVKLCERIEEANDASFNHAGQYSYVPDHARTRVCMDIGKKYAKIIRSRGLVMENESVWGFIFLPRHDDKFIVGDILKAESWRRPALNKARGNVLMDDYQIYGTRQYGPDYLR
tara:strand:- start:24100 stop:24543 length:444 start_codon:yes stop_codon:yes gene_type:complete